MNIVGFHVKNSTIASSEGEVIQSPPYIKWLLKHPQQTIQTFYHMSFCLEELLHILSINGEARNELISTTKLEISPYKYRCVPNKFFSIKRSSHQLSYFCDMSQYCDVDLKSLAILDKESEVDYCIRVAKEAKEIGMKVYSTLQELGLNPVSLTSLTRICERSGKVGIDCENVREYIVKSIDKSSLKVVS